MSLRLNRYAVPWNAIGTSSVPIALPTAIWTDDARATIPAKLTSLLSNPDTIDFTKEMLRKALAKRGVSEANVGGSLDQPVYHYNNINVKYFAIHDTSTPFTDSPGFDPDYINISKWSGNRLSGLAVNKTHVYITRNGFTKTDQSYKEAVDATRFETPTLHTGLFLHHELIQPRIKISGIDAKSPDPGFTPIQYELLALCYLASSFRRGKWLIPAFHCVIIILLRLEILTQ